jgi:hypothetical protein
VPEWDTGYAALTAPSMGDDLLIRDVTATPPAAGTIKRISASQVGALASADIPRIFGAGHSYLWGYLNTENAERYFTNLCAGLHAEEVIYGQSGAVLAQDSSSSEAGGYANVLNALTPRVASGSGYAVRNSAPFLPLAPVAVLHYGVNDLAWLTSTAATNINWFKMALTACACVARAGGWFPDTDSSVAYGGSGGSHWTGNSGAFYAVYGWPSNHATTTLLDTVTITVPATFPGGEVDILTLAYSGGAKWSAVVDSGSPQVLDGTGSAYGANSGRSNLVVQRITGLSAGAHTIVVTLTALDGGASAFFQGWLIAAPGLPTVALVNQPAFPALPLTVGGAAHTPVTSSDVTSLNTAIAAVAAAFTDGNVVVADIATAFAGAGGNVAYTSPNSLYVSDNFHPNAAGNALTALTVRDAIRSAPLPSAARFGPTGIVMRQLNGPLEPALSAGWSIVAQAWASGWFGKDRAGNTVVRLTLQKSSAGVAGEVICTLPPGYQPGIQVIVPGFSWGAAYASVSNDGLLAIEPNQQLQWFTGDPTTELDVAVSWYADGVGS